MTASDGRHQRKREVKIFFDVPSLRQLAAAGWKPAPAEGAALLRTAVDNDDLPHISAFIDLGVPIESPSGEWISPVLAAKSGRVRSQVR